MQFEDGVGHRGQNSLSLHDVDVPDPECERERSLTTNTKVLFTVDNVDLATFQFFVVMKRPNPIMFSPSVALISEGINTFL